MGDVGRRERDLRTYPCGCADVPGNPVKIIICDEHQAIADTDDD